MLVFSLGERQGWQGRVLSIIALFLLLAPVLGAIEYVVVINIDLRGNMAFLLV